MVLLLLHISVNQFPPTEYVIFTNHPYLTSGVSSLPNRPPSGEAVLLTIHIKVQTNDTENCI